MIDGYVLREGSDTQVARSGVDLIAGLVVRHVGPDPRHDARHVVSEHERCLVLQEEPELAVAYHLVQRVDAGSTHPDEDVTGPDGGIGHLCGAETAFAIFLDDECLHDRPPVVRRLLGLLVVAAVTLLLSCLTGGASAASEEPKAMSESAACAG